MSVECVLRRVRCVCRMAAVGLALEELLVAAQRQDHLTLGVYESAQRMNV